MDIRPRSEILKEKFGMLSREQKLLVGILVAVILLSLYVNSVYKPLSEQVSRAGIRAESTKRELISVIEKEPDTGSLEKRNELLTARLDRITQKLASLESKLPPYGGIPQLLGSLSREAEAAGVEIETIRPRTERGGTYAQIDVDMNISGRFEDIVNYLMRLELLSDFIDAVNVEISHDKDLARNFNRALLKLSILLGEPGRREYVSFDPVTVDRGPIALEDPFVSKYRQRSETDEESFILTGVSLGGKIPTAIINDEVYVVGDKIGDMSVKHIESEKVILKDGHGRKETVFMH